MSDTWYCPECHQPKPIDGSHRCHVQPLAPAPANVHAELPAIRARIERAMRVGATAQEWKWMAAQMLAVIDAAIDH